MPPTRSPPIRIVIYEPGAGGYWAEFSAFPGVYAEGDTIDDVLRDAVMTLARYFELRDGQRGEDDRAREWSHENGPIPSIPVRSDGPRMPLSGRVKEARALAAERRRKVLDALPDEPSGTDEALLEALGVDVLGRT